MNEYSWRRMIISALNNMSDKDYQRRSWTGLGPEVSSPDEIINTLFDDARLSEYLIEHQNNITPETLIVKDRLVRVIDSLGDEPICAENADSIINSPSWIEIRKLANKLKLLLDGRR